nr:MAG TPA: hypothetical protein [Caudoviricetes sp.]DAW51510.1 MAG TPA: hypothetical protein [Caudoviricetes sp.]
MLPKAVANRYELSRRWSYQPWEIITNFVASNFSNYEFQSIQLVAH